MKITKAKLKQMIAEEMESLQEVRPGKLTGDLEARDRVSAKTYPAAALDLTDEEDDFQRARELERATDAGEPRTDREAASRRRAALRAKSKATMANIQARNLPRRRMDQKEQDPELRRQRRDRASRERELTRDADRGWTQSGGKWDRGLEQQIKDKLMSLETDPEERERLYNTGGLDVNNLPADWDEYGIGGQAYKLGLIEEEPSVLDLEPMDTGPRDEEEPSVLDLEPMDTGPRDEEEQNVASKWAFEQIVREELEAVLAERPNPDEHWDADERRSVSHAGQQKAARSVWELYSQDRATRPKVPHPDGEDVEDRLNAKRQKRRLAMRKARDWPPEMPPVRP